MARTTARPTGTALALLTTLTLLLASLGVRPALADPDLTDDPAEAAAGWLVTALTDDPAVGSDFGPSVGPTIDVLFALAAVGVAAGTIDDIAAWVTTQVAAYTQGDGFDAEDAAYAGATAKLALGLLVTDRDPRDAGGIDLIDQLLSLEIDDPDAGIVGRFSDRGEFGDFSTPLTQSLALLALHRAPGVEPSAQAISALVDQACDDGGFPSQFAPEACTSSVDTTGLAVQALVAVGATDAAAGAVAWLQSVQAADGSFSSPDGVNTNATGLAAAALSVAGASDSAADAAAWIVSQQDGCDTDSPGAIPFNVDDRGSVELATSQAILGLVGASLATITREGASDTIPTLDCEAAEEIDQAPTEEPVGEGDREPAAEPDDQEPVAEQDDGQSTAEEDIPQPTRVDSGLSPSVPTWQVLTLLLGALLLFGGAVTGLQQRREPR